MEPPLKTQNIGIQRAPRLVNKHPCARRVARPHSTGSRSSHTWDLCGSLSMYLFICLSSYLFSSVQLLIRVQLFATPWTAARQASLSITNSRSSLKLMSIELVMPSNHLILCRPLLLPPSIFPSIRAFQMSQLFSSGGQSIGVSA